MKHLNKFYYSIFCLLFYIFSFAQYSVTISDMYVNNQPINSSPISFVSGDEITVKFFVQVNGNNSGSSNDALNIYYQKGNAYSPIVPTGGYGGNSRGRWFTIQLNAAQFDTNGGFIFAQFAAGGMTAYKSSNWPVVKPAIPPISNNSITGTQTIYYGRSTSISGSNPTGGTGSYTYKWQSNADGTWNVIPGALDQNFFTEALTQTTQFRRIVFSAGENHISGEVKITVINSLPITGNIISGNQTINEGNTASQLTGNSVSGGSGPGSYKYTWQKKNVDGSWSDIVNANTANYMPGTPFVTTSYRRIVKSGNAADSISNEITITVIPAPLLQNNVISINGVLVTGSQPTGGTESYTYKWIVYGVGEEEPIVLSATTQSITIPSSIYNLVSVSNIYVARVVTSASQNLPSNSVLIQSLPEIGNNTIILNGTQLIGSLPTGGYPGQYTYEWWGYHTIDGEVIGEVFQLSGTGQSNSIQTIPGLPTNYYRVVKSGNKVSYSNAVSYFPSRRLAASPIKKALNPEPKVYPNPTTKRVNFETGLVQTTPIEIIASNELGINAVVFKGNVNPGQVIEWNIPSNYPKGLYFYKILSGNEEIKTGKILYQ
ncbi:T9SS type A sorting domain-containing protein [Flavobacterium lindanitolerans]|uniref:T9SS type A sorting domain-containing protein n=1 Tax=Flavobacterium lindanitolerans TaxID=428988 RepID=UPI0031E29A00